VLTRSKHMLFSLVRRCSLLNPALDWQVQAVVISFFCCSLTCCPFERSQYITGVFQYVVPRFRRSFLFARSHNSKTRVRQKMKTFCTLLLFAVPALADDAICSDIEGYITACVTGELTKGNPECDTACLIGLQGQDNAPCEGYHKGTCCCPPCESAFRDTLACSDVDEETCTPGCVEGDVPAPVDDAPAPVDDAPAPADDTPAEEPPAEAPTTSSASYQTAMWVGHLVVRV